ncbi:hypothetical protein LY78DRAFT_141289 [Colletotrichum sublineola]|nr:hypothetical protein LY78DRAFT_141289 [Colletotrichum sublineola]
MFFIRSPAGQIRRQGLGCQFVSLFPVRCSWASGLLRGSKVRRLTPPRSFLVGCMHCTRILCLSLGLAGLRGVQGG